MQTGDSCSTIVYIKIVKKAYSFNIAFKVCVSNKIIRALYFFKLNLHYHIFRIKKIIIMLLDALLTARSYPIFTISTPYG